MNMYQVVLLMFCMNIGRGLSLSAQNILFDFDNAPLQTSLPVSQTVDGVTANFSATGQGYSIQNANVLGFTPLGFSGRCIYPNSIYLADLLINFDSTLSDFSIMYSCQELGCDDAATMRVTAYMQGSLVGTSTMTATNPGTWPTEILRCNFSQGFNSVVIHYDKRPPTCQDYGVIFMADNMRITTYHPTIVPLCPGPANGIILSDLTGNLYQWQISSGSIFSNITDDVNYTGSNTPSLQLNNIPSNWSGTKYRCVVDGNYSNIFTLQFKDSWTGISDTAWENPLNWSCNKVPDENTDVQIDTGVPNDPTINTTVYCRSLTVMPGAIIKINTGADLQITGKK
jgi:hypothetical protein